MSEHRPQSGQDGTPIRWWRRRWFKVITSLCLLAGLGFLLTAEYLLHHAEPILRRRIVETLSDRFNAPVELDRLDLSLFKGIQVTGMGLRIPFGSAPANLPDYSLLAVEQFRFRTTLRGLLRQPMHIDTVDVTGLELHIPPPDQRKKMLGEQARRPIDLNDPNGLKEPGLRPKVAMVVNTLRCRDVRLFIESGKSGKDPLFFDIRSLDMRDVGRNQAMLYRAELTNPKPQGIIHATGHFGPWAGEAQPGKTKPRETPPDPGQTPLDGTYTFDHADLNTIHGIGGMLSSTGHFSGVLDRIAIAGTTDVPNFSLDISDRPMPLHTEFQAVVDGTSGDTYLNPVRARLQNSDFTTSGKIVNLKGRGHDIDLQVDIPQGRMQDFLRLAVKTNPPVMNGTLALKARLHIPPGTERVPLKLQMAGAFRMVGIRLNNPQWQDRLDGLSARAMGRPQDVAKVSHDGETEAHSTMQARFTIGHGILSVADIQYQVPGARVLLNGVYSMDGKLFDFKGHVRTDATASQMVTGWKSWLLKPVDPFLKKHGAGVELPIEVNGTGGDVHMGLALNGADDRPGEILQDLRQKSQHQRELAAAKKEAALADEKDLEAAHAPTLAAAEASHRVAVQHREQARRLAQAAQHP